MDSIKGKVVIVTGGANGLGLRCVKTFYNHGAHVFIAARNPERCAAVATEVAAEGGEESGQVEHLNLDLSRTASIRACAKEFMGRGLKLDCLINNAAVAATGPRCVITEDGLELMHQTNIVGPYLLMRLLQPCLSANARVIFVSSNYLKDIPLPTLEANLTRDRGGGMQAAAWAAQYYGNTKLLNAILARALAEAARMEGSQVVLAVHPGVSNETGIIKQQVWLSRFFFHLTYMFAGSPTEAEVAHTIAWSATEPSLASQSGAYVHGPRPPKVAPVPNKSYRDAEYRAGLLELLDRTIEPFLLE